MKCTYTRGRERQSEKDLFCLMISLPLSRALLFSCCFLLWLTSVMMLSDAKETRHAMSPKTKRAFLAISGSASQTYSLNSPTSSMQLRCTYTPEEEETPSKASSLQAVDQLLQTGLVVAVPGLNRETDGCISTAAIHACPRADVHGVWRELRLPLSLSRSVPWTADEREREIHTYTNIWTCFYVWRSTSIHASSATAPNATQREISTCADRTAQCTYTPPCGHVANRRGGILQIQLRKTARERSQE